MTITVQYFAKKWIGVCQEDSKLPEKFGKFLTYLASLWLVCHANPKPARRIRKSQNFTSSPGRRLSSDEMARSFQYNPRKLCGNSYEDFNILEIFCNFLMHLVSFWMACQDKLKLSRSTKELQNLTNALIRWQSSYECQRFFNIIKKPWWHSLRRLQPTWKIW